jgi:hypothetical protein
LETFAWLAVHWLATGSRRHGSVVLGVLGSRRGTGRWHPRPSV